MKPIRVALSGSGFKFPAHVGALAAIRDAGYTPIEYAGTSGGSIVASLAATGMSVDDMKTMTMGRDWSSMLSFNLFSLLFKKGFCSGNNLLAFITEQTKGKTFAQLDTDLVVMASDLSNAAPFEFSKKTTPDVQVAFAARSSASIPVAYAPMSYSDVLLEDGGVENNIPADKLTLDDVPRIGIQLVAKESHIDAKSITLFSMLPRLVGMMLDANENTHVDLEQNEGTQFAFIETGFANGLDRNMSVEVRQKLYDNGYAGAKAALEKLKSGPEA